MNIDTFPSLFTARGRGVGLLAGLLAMALLFAGCDDDGGGSDLDNPTDLTIQQVIDARNEASAFKNWAELGGANVDLGNENSTFTVFLPVNGAFETLSGEYLNNEIGRDLKNQIIADHVIQGQAISASDVQSDGNDLVAGDLRIEKASIVTQDLEASNGIIHFIDRVQLKSLNVRQRIAADLSLQTVGTAATTTGQASTFEGDGPFTVFAPTDPAFASVNTEALLGQSTLLQKIIGSHAISGEGLTASDLQGTTQTSLAGHELNFSFPDEGPATVDGQPIETADILASNGVIHKIGGVILNQATVGERASITNALAAVTDLVVDAGLRGTLDDENQTFTVFAPVNSGFASVDTMALKMADDNLNQEILNSHVHAGDAVRAEDLDAEDAAASTTISTLAGRDVTVTKDTTGTVSLVVRGDTVGVSATDIPVQNGVVHLIEQPLLDQANVVERAEITSATTDLASALKAKGLASTLESASDVTVFAPTNSAINALNVDPENDFPTLTEDILKYHVADANFSLPIDTSVSTLESAELNVRENTVSSDNSPPGEPGLNGAVALEGGTNIKTLNGTIHLIDAMLLSRATITERAVLEPVLDSLAGAATDADLDDDLNDKSEEFTVFAPTNAAFGAYKDTLFQDADLQETVLRSHTVSDEARTENVEDEPVTVIEDGDKLTSLQAEDDGESDDLKFNVDGSSVEVNEVPVAAADVDAHNGVVHVISDVLLHQTTALERALVTPGFGTLVDLVQSADESVGEALNTRDGITVFAPTNAAFTAALDTNETEGLQDGEIPSGGALDSLLKYHVVDEPLRVRDVPRTQEMFPTLVGNSEGDEVGLVRSADGVVTVDPDSTNPSTVTIPDVNVDNGWIQGVDTILDNRGN